MTQPDEKNGTQGDVKGKVAKGVPQKGTHEHFAAGAATIADVLASSATGMEAEHPEAAATLHVAAALERARSDQWQHQHLLLRAVHQLSQQVVALREQHVRSVEALEDQLKQIRFEIYGVASKRS